MAKKIQKKTKKGDNKQFIIIGVFIVIVTMVLSSIFYFSEKNNPETPRGNQPEPVIDKYQINQIGNSSVVVNISSITSDVIVIPDSRCLYFDTIKEIQDISGNITYSSEVADPSISSQDGAPIICSFYIMFKFNTGDGNNSLNLNDIKQKLGKSSVFQGYIASLPISVSGSDKVYVVGQPGSKAGDYLRITLYQKIVNGLETGVIGFGERRVPIGPVLSATVVNVTDIIVQGTVDTDFPSGIQERLNASEFNFLPPKILINNTIENKTAEMLDNLRGVSVSINSEENSTEISFNNSKSDILKILGNENLSYSLQNGGLIFKIPLNSGIDNTRKILTDDNVKDVRFGKEGTVSLPAEFMLGTTPVPIRNNNMFNAVLEMDRKPGDRINVSMNTIRFGEQIIAFGASEVKGNGASA